MASRSADLAGELVELTAAVCAEVAAGDDRRLEEIVARRLELVSLLAAEAPAHAAREALERLVRLDGELLARVQARRADVRAALDHLCEHGRVLAAYRGAPPRSPLYVERLG